MMAENIDKLPLACSAIASGVALLKSIFARKNGNGRCKVPEACTAHAATVRRLEEGDELFKQANKKITIMGSLIVDMAAKEGLIDPMLKDNFKESFK